jgi:hypothetical protein
VKDVRTDRIEREIHDRNVLEVAFEPEIIQDEPTTSSVAFKLTYKSQRIPLVQTCYQILNRHSISLRVYRWPVDVKEEAFRKQSKKKVSKILNEAYENKIFSLFCYKPEVFIAFKHIFQIYRTTPKSK